MTTSVRSSSVNVRKWVTLAAAVAAGIAWCGAAAATDRTWQGTVSPDWFDPANWDPAVVPTGDNRVFFPLKAVIANQPTIGGTDTHIEALLIDNSGGTPYSVGGTAVLSVQAPARALFTGIQLIGGGTTPIEPVIRPIRSHVVDVQNNAQNESILQLNGGLTGVESLLKLGNGTLELNYRSNNFLGDFRIGQGTLRAGGNSGSPVLALRSNLVTVETGATFAVPAAAASQAMVGAFAGGGTVDATGKRLTLFPLGVIPTSGTITVGTGTQSIQVQGAGTQVFMGNTTLNGSIILAQSGNVTLARSATFNPTGITTPTAPSTTLQNNAALLAKGGFLTLDNTAENNNDRLQGNGYLMTAGGGGLTLIGNTAGTSESLNQPLMAFSGAGKVHILHNAGNNAATVLTFPGLGQGNSTATMDFSSNVPFAAGNAPRVMLGTAHGFNFVNAFDPQTTIILNGTLGLDGGTFPDSTGMYTVNGTDFAAYDSAAGIVPVATTGFPSAAGDDPTANVLFAGSGSPTTLTFPVNWVVNTLKIAPTTDGQSFNITGAGDLEISGYLLVGPRRYTISSTGGGKVAGRHTRYFHIADPDGVLTITADIGGLGPTNLPANTQNKPISKAGPGVLELAGANNFLANNTNINVLEGTLRAAVEGNPSGLPVGLPTFNTTLRFRGGVFEIKGGGTFSRFLNRQSGHVNWGVAATEGGSGGFSAFGGSARVDLNGLDVRDELKWRDNNFVFEDNALLFGSHTADSVIEWFDHIGLSSGTTDNFYSAREFRVFDNPNSVGDRAIITGEIRSHSLENGGMNADFLKTGPGVLELAAAQNTYLGNTLVKEGALIIRGDQASAGYLVKPGASLEIHGAVPQSADFRLDGGQTVFNGSKSFRTLRVGAAATAFITRPGAALSVVSVKHLAIETGRVDIGDNAMVVDYEPNVNGDIHEVRQHIRTAYNNGAWDGPGITSNAIDENPGTAIGYAESADVLDFPGGSDTATFLGQTVDDSSILVRWTKSGDANLDGNVNFDDLAWLAQNYNTSGDRTWDQGDFTYDGAVNFDDLALMAQNYNTTINPTPAPGAFSAAFEADFAAALASVPEPGSLTALGIGACLLVQRRRRPPLKWARQRA